MLINSEVLDRLVAGLGDRSALIGIYGMVYVGQPLALRHSKLGYRVLGFDIDQKKVDDLSSGHSAIEYINDCEIAEANAAGMRCAISLAGTKLCY